MASAATIEESKDSKEGMDERPMDKSNAINNAGVDKVSIKLNLEPGKIYEFRVAASNVAGSGPWSEISIFKVPEPANIPIPSNIKLTATKNGVKVAWDMIPNAKDVREYLCFISVPSEGSNNECKYMPIYTGTRKSFTLNKETIEMAAIDKSGGAPAILLRIVAKSDLGYGPAIHVRCVKNWN